MADQPQISRMNTSIEYDWRASGWCVVLRCVPPCTCGQMSSVGPFPSKAAAVAYDDQLQASWRDSELRRIAAEAREALQ
jgi:hypothetical protein